MAKIISTDGSDYPYEKVIAHGGNCTMQRRLLHDAANALNEIAPDGPLYYKVVDNDYHCKKGLEDGAEKKVGISSAAARHFGDGV